MNATADPAVARRSQLVLRVVAAAGLAVDAYVHFHLAGGYDAVTAAVGQGTLFRIEGAAAAVAALVVLLVRTRLAALFALVVAAGGVAAVLLYAYVDVGAIGPFPDMYEPVWYQEKLFSVIAEAIAALAALALLRPRRQRGR